MRSFRTLVGLFLLITSTANLGISVEIADVDERLSVIASSIAMFLAGVLAYRAHRSWPLTVIAASFLYCFLVAPASCSMLFTGMYRTWWYSLVLPTQDPTIHPLAKASLIYFQGVLAFALILVTVFALVAAFTHRKVSCGNRA